MVLRHVACGVAVGLIALVAAYPGFGAPAQDDDPDFPELRSAEQAPAKPAAATKTPENPGSRYILSDKKSPPEGRLGKSKSGGAAGGEKSRRQAILDAKRKKLAKIIAARLGKLLPAGRTKPRPKKAPDDYFVVGTSEVRLLESHADVRFESVQGQQEVADRLADYVVNAPEHTLRQWHVFARVKTDEEAESFLKDLRAQWDATEKLQAQQARMAQSMSLAYRSAYGLRQQMGGYARTMCRT